MTSPDLIEKVARAICEAEAGGVWEPDRWAAKSYWHDDFANMARAAIAVVLEEAAKIAESCHPAYPQTQAGRDNYDACDIIAKHIRSRLTKEST